MDDAVNHLHVKKLYRIRNKMQWECVLKLHESVKNVCKTKTRPCSLSRNAWENKEAIHYLNSLWNTVYNDEECDDDDDVSIEVKQDEPDEDDEKITEPSTDVCIDTDDNIDDERQFIDLSNMELFSQVNA